MVRLTEEVEGRVTELHSEGKGVTHIARDTGASTHSVLKWLYKLGLKKRFEPHEAKCEACEETYWKKQEIGKFCSQRCRNNGQPKDKSNCERCGTLIVARGFRKFCADGVCREERLEEDKAGRPEVVYVPKSKTSMVCAQCNGNYETHQTSSTYCSESCGRRHRRILDRVYRSVKCKECSRFFRTHDSTRVYCGVSCSKRYEYRIKGNKRLELMKSNGKVDWAISVERLMKRDGKECHICGVNVNHNVHYNNDNYPNVDHVKPLSKGGTHTWDNVKIAHRMCNIKKAATWE